LGWIIRRKRFTKLYLYPNTKTSRLCKIFKYSCNCFPRGIKNYKNYCNIVKPDAVNIDYDVDPTLICREIKIPVQGGLDPKVLLTDTDNLKKTSLKIFRYF